MGTRQTIVPQAPRSQAHAAGKPFARNSNVVFGSATFQTFAGPRDRYLGGLKRHGLEEVYMVGDGACLFRSAAHQVYGDASLHWLVREKVADFMSLHKDHFAPFVLGDFDAYVQDKRLPSTWGDDPEIAALGSLYKAAVEIWSYDPATGARKRRTLYEGRDSASGGNLV
jgi:hypothetical protein